MGSDAPIGGSIHAHIAGARHTLTAAGLPSEEAALDARLLAQQALGWDTLRMLVEGHMPATSQFERQYGGLVARRARREPLAYIIGAKEFWGLSFDVNPDVLIPRPETELIVERVLTGFPDRRAALAIADIGTGSGCLAVSLAREYPSAVLLATDISAKAVAVARRNAIHHGVADRVSCACTDLLDGIDSTFDLLVSNPPYVPDAERDGLQPEVRDFEPAVALFAGNLGLDIIERVLALAPQRLRPGGLLIFEFGIGQEDANTELLSHQHQLTMEAIVPDLQGIPRVAVARRL